MSKKEQLLDAAEVRVRKGGYNNFSFREIADEIGIKSSSVHYHFPTKAEMASELAVRYTQNFIAALGDVNVIVSEGKDPIAFYIAQFKRALTEDKLMCLCGLLAAESAMLPPQVLINTRGFFDQNLAWLSAAFKLSQNLDEDLAKRSAFRLIAKLEGAMLMSQVMEDDTVFDSIMES